MPAWAILLAVLGAADSGVAGSVPQRYRAPVFADVDVARDVPFRTARDEDGVEQKLTLDIYTPAGDAVRSRPAILWIHGGGFKPGNDKTQSYIVEMATAFARRGYVSVSTDYRVRRSPVDDPRGTLRDAVEDCRAALAWMRANGTARGLDPRRIAVGGGSAGGMTAINVVAEESAGKSPLFAFVDLWGSPGEPLRPAITRRFPPTVIVHGTADQLVPFANSEWLAAELERVHVVHRLHALPGARHTPADRLDEIIDWTSRFACESLPPVPAARRSSSSSNCQ